MHANIIIPSQFILVKYYLHDERATKIMYFYCKDGIEQTYQSMMFSYENGRYIHKSENSDMLQTGSFC